VFFIGRGAVVDIWEMKYESSISLLLQLCEIAIHFVSDSHNFMSTNLNTWVCNLSLQGTQNMRPGQDLERPKR
jgi:hypothetical protein